MGRLIDADALRKEIHCAYSDDLGILDHIEAQRTVDAVPVRHGQWIERGYMGNDNWDYMCSVCGAGEVHTKRVEVRYCWNCGARMDGEENGNEAD